VGGLVALPNPRAMTAGTNQPAGNDKAAGVISLDTCPKCGKRSESDTFCSHCSSSLYVDLILESWKGDERSKYAAAKKLSEHKLAGLSFTSLKKALAGQPGTLVGARLGRSAARLAVATLAGYGGTLTVRPSRPRSRSKLWMGAAASGLLLVLVVVLTVMGDRPEKPPEPVAEKDAPAKQALEEPEMIDAEDASAEKPQKALTTGQISAAVKGAIATVTCRGKLGTAFFVEAQRAVTNAHVACGQDEKVTVKLQDGRELPGEVIVWKPGLDLAVIEVPQAQVDPISMGDSTALAVGDPVVFIGNPHGLASTMHEAKVSFGSRNLHGVSYLQINGDVNPGNSGGPLLDLQARVIGIISMKATKADRIGFALPVEYLEPYLATLALSPEAQARWQETLDRARQEDQQEVQALMSLYMKPALISVTPISSEKLFAVVLTRSKTSPGIEQLIVDISTSGLVLCSTEGKVSDWIKVEKAMKKARLKDPDSRYMKWIITRQVAKDLFLGTLVVEIDHCRKESTTKEAILRIKDGGESKETVHFPKAALERMRKRTPVPGWRSRDPGFRGVRRPRSQH